MCVASLMILSVWEQQTQWKRPVLCLSADTFCRLWLVCEINYQIKTICSVFSRLSVSDQFSARLQWWDDVCSPTELVFYRMMSVCFAAVCRFIFKGESVLIVDSLSLHLQSGCCVQVVVRQQHEPAGRAAHHINNRTSVITVSAAGSLFIHHI